MSLGKSQKRNDNDMTQKVSYLELIMYTFKNVPSEL